MNEVTAIIKTQRIVVEPSSQAVRVISAGPVGPAGQLGAGGILYLYANYA